jgi:predicted nucleic acid-binding protein
VTILDTNVVSELMKPVPAPQVLQWIGSQRSSRELCITTITVAEVLFGIELLPKGKRRDSLLADAEATFADDFAGRLLPFEEAAARAFPEIAANRRLHGRPISLFDAQIAAIARSHGALLATRNSADFEDCGIHLVNPWGD